MGEPDEDDNKKSLEEFAKKEDLEIVASMTMEDVVKKLRKQKGNFVLLSAPMCPKDREILKKGGFDPSNPVVSGETLAELMESECKGCDGHSCLTEGVECHNPQKEVIPK